MIIKGDRVIGHMGDVLAEKIQGEWHSKDAAALDFLANQHTLVRARDKVGKFLPDDPVTPDVNEAWIAKPLKKARKK
jgi:hypothetical protein